MERIERNRSAALKEMLLLGQYAVDFAGVERATHRLDGRKENDAEHSLTLLFVASQLAAKLYPELDLGKIAQFSAIHDMPEVLVGDTHTFGISNEARAAKEVREAEAAAFLIDDLPAPWGDLLCVYEEQVVPETRFVRRVDKLMPALLHIHGDGKSTFADEYGVMDAEAFWKMRGNRLAELSQQYPEFPEISHLEDELIAYAANRMWPDESP